MILYRQKSRPQEQCSCTRPIDLFYLHGERVSGQVSYNERKAREVFEYRSLKGYIVDNLR
jgi:hypothetical protein